MAIPDWESLMHERYFTSPVYIPNILLLLDIFVSVKSLKVID